MHKFPVGTLVARVEAPTVVWRVTSIGRTGRARVIPYRASYVRDHLLAVVGDSLVGDGSVWHAVEALS